ncbi:MAG: hypothetical protein HQL73_02180 [Magnetococcales bacterium]|nr:hypothetical protein [Magnetococcales bacterium]
MSRSALIETSHSMERLRQLLSTTPLPFHEALGVAKEMMLHGVNDKEVLYYQKAAILLLERVFRPAFQGNVEQESKLKRLMAKVGRTPGLDPGEVLGEVSKMVAAPSAQASGATAELANQEADRLARWLLSLPGFASVVANRPATYGWPEVEEMVATCVQEQGREQRRLERERYRRQGSLFRLVDTLVQTAERVHHPVTELHQARALLESQEPPGVVLPAFVDRILVEIGHIKAAMVAAQQNVHQANAAMTQLNELFRQADRQLQESRDQELFDIFTGLGNRFALTEVRKRYGSDHHQVLLFLYLDKDPDAFPRLNRGESYRILGFIGRHIEKSDLGQAFYVGDETIVIIVADQYADKDIAHPIKNRILDRLQATKGFPTHVRFGLVTMAITGTAIMDEAALLDKGKHWARNSARRGGLPLKTTAGQAEPLPSHGD